MVWFTAPKISAVSDSFLSLIALRREFGLPCTPNEDTIRGRMWLNSMSYQQLGYQTYCTEIQFCTPGTELTFSFDTGVMKDTPLNLFEYFQGSVTSHAQAVRESASRMVQTMQAYATTGGITTLGLSGGTDSRVCLAAALAADMGDRLHVASKDNGTNDFEVAVELSKSFGFTLNSSRPEVHGTLLRRDGATTWAAGSLGIYDALYATDRFRKVEHPVFAVAGQGAEAAKGNFGWRQITSIGMPPEGLTQSQQALESIGCDSSNKWGSEWHYLAFRNGIHAGRGTQNAEYLPRPAAQIPLIGLSRSALNQFPTPRKHQPNIVLDTLIVLNPGLAAHRFDDPVKNASKSFIDERLQILGGQIDARQLEPYRVLGTPMPSPGYSRTLLNIAASMGFTGSLSGKNLAPFVQESLTRFEPLISDSVRNGASKVSLESSETLRAGKRDTSAIGKLVALSILD